LPTARDGESQKRWLIRVARAWRRCLLTPETESLHSDGQLIVRDLLNKSAFFGRQYGGTAEETLILAVKRQMVIDTLALLGITEAQITTIMELDTQDD